MIQKGTKGRQRRVARVRRTGKVLVRGALALLLYTGAEAFGPSSRVLGPGVAHAQQVPPDEAWRTLSTGRVRVTFPERLEPLARRAAYRAEVALDALEESFLPPPRGTIELLLTDHTDFSNGFAQVTPSNRVTIYARPPVDEAGLGYFDDWLELVVTHELAHIVHLDRTGTTLGQVLRTVFGRVPGRWPYFPGHAAPRWVTEGLATWYESALTDAGRVEGTFHEMQLRAAVLGGRFEDVGQASASSPVWPGGNRPYAYGSLFFEHLLDRYGEDRMAVFAESLAGQWIPYRIDAAGREAFGVSISDAWRDWKAALEARYADLDGELAAFGPVTEPERLTHRARWAVGPAVGPDGQLAYVRSDGRSDARIVIGRLPATGGGAAGVDRDGVESDGSSSLRVNGIGSIDWTPGGLLLVGQLEYLGPNRLLSDLWIMAPDGAHRRLTYGARLAQPSASPTGGWGVAVQEGEGTSRLVRVDLQTGEVAPLGPDDPAEHWAYPSVSPDGRWVAATRWRSGGFHDVVVLDASTGHVAAELTEDRALDLAPRWSPDGRWVVWASDRTGILNVLAAPFDPTHGTTGAPRLLTNVRTGVTFPAVTSDGRSLLLSLYHAEGWDVARVPFEPESAPPAPDPDARFAPTHPFVDGSWAGPVRGYSPLPTLLPRFWKPLFREPVRTAPVLGQDLLLRERQLLGYAVGAQTGGSDLVGRHGYDVFGRVFLQGARVDAGLAYAYAGLGNPVLSVGATQFWDQGGVRLGRTEPAAPLDTLFVLERERAAYGSASFVVPSWRRSLRLTLRGGWVQERRELLDNDLRPSTTYSLARPDVALGEVRATVAFSTARSFAFQVGGSRGFDAMLTARARRELQIPDSLAGVTGQDRGVEDLVGRVAGYVPLGGPGHAPHVFAVQLAGGGARGPNAPGGHFDVGGASGRSETVTGLSLFGGSPVFFPVRGYPTGTRRGRYAWAASGEYRFPIRLVHRGLGAWPLYLGRVTGTVFADGGDAWDPEATDGSAAWRGPLASAGGEVGAEFLVLYDFTLVTRLGVAHPLIEGAGPVVYLRLGLPF